MSGAISTYLSTALLNHVFGGVVYTPPIGLFVALYTVAPTVDGGGTEVAGGGYSRLGVSFSAASGSPPVTSNPNALQWPAASAPWGMVVAGGVFDAPSLGNYLGGAPLVSAVDGITPAPLNVPAGAIFRLPALGLVLSFVVPPSSPVPFVGPPTRRLGMRPIIGAVVDGSGIERQGVVMVPAP